MLLIGWPAFQLSDFLKYYQICKYRYLPIDTIIDHVAIDVDADILIDVVYI